MLDVTWRSPVVVGMVVRSAAGAGARRVQGLLQHVERADVVGEQQHEPRVERVALRAWSGRGAPRSAPRRSRRARRGCGWVISSMASSVRRCASARLSAALTPDGGRLAPARADVLVGAQQVDGAGPQRRSAARPGRRRRSARRHAQPTRSTCSGRPRASARERCARRAVAVAEHQRGEAVAPSSRSSQPRAAVGAHAAAHRRPARPAPCAPAKASASGVFSGEPCSVAGTDSRPLLTSVRANGWSLARSSSTASRNSAADLALRRDEVGRAGRVAGCSRRPRTRARRRSCRAARRAPCRCSTSGELPGQVVGVLHAGVGAARAERRHAVRRVAGEQHAAVAEARPCAGRRRCRRWPIRARTARPSSPMRRAAPRTRGMMFSGFFSSSGSASQPSWKSMRQTPSGCLCSSTLWLRMERRIEPEPALGREVDASSSRRRSGSGRGRRGPCSPGRSAARSAERAPSQATT